MTDEQAKNFLAYYDESLSYRDIEKRTGVPIDRLRQLYDEILYSGELEQRKRDYNKFVRYRGIYRINPITFSVKKYETRVALEDDGYNVSNIFNCCKNKRSMSFDCLWRFGKDIDLHNIKDSVINSVPDFFLPIMSINPDTGEETRYSTVFMATSVGYNRGGILSVIKGKKKTHRGLFWCYCN